MPFGVNDVRLLICRRQRSLLSSSFCDLGVGCSATHFFRHSLCCLDGLMMTTMLRQRRQYAGSDSIADARNAFIPFALVCVLTRGKRLMGLGLRNRVTYSVPIPFRGTQMSSNSIPLSSSEWRRRDNSHCFGMDREPHSIALILANGNLW